MGDNTPIEWVRALAASRNAIPATWNPIDGCSRASEGCRLCYAAQFVHQRLSKSLPGRFAGLTEMDGNGAARFNGRVKLAAHVLDQPIKARRPRVYFVCDMSDLFHPSVPAEWLDRIFASMAAGRQHTYLLLTKRPENMRAYVTDPDTPARIDAVLDQHLPAHWCARELEDFGGWPLPNVWLGATVTDQKEADTSVPELLATPASTRFLSMEPLLAPVRIPGLYPVGEDGIVTTPALNWVITGGESGSRARISDLESIRSVRRQCSVAGVPVFVKQLGRRCQMKREDAAWSVPAGAGWQVDADTDTGVVSFVHIKGGDPAEWPEDLRVQQFPVREAA